jgi:hypothetical protein
MNSKEDIEDNDHIDEDSLKIDETCTEEDDPNSPFNLS